MSIQQDEKPKSKKPVKPVSTASKARGSMRTDELQRKTARRPKAAGGDGGTTIRANQSPAGEDESSPPET